MYLLDSIVISELPTLGDCRADANLTAWFADRDANSFLTSVITLMELEIGILRVTRNGPVTAKMHRSSLGKLTLSDVTSRQ